MSENKMLISYKRSSLASESPAKSAPSQLLRASNLFALLTIMQLLVWILVDPSLVVIQGLSQKYISLIAIFRFIALNSIMFAMLRFAEVGGLLKLCNKGPVCDESLKSKIAIILGLYCIGIVATLAPVFQDFGFYLNLASQSSFAAISSETEETSIGTLTNLGPLIVAFCSTLLFSRACSHASKRFYFSAIAFVFLCSILEGLLLSRRVQFFICIFAFFIPMMLVRKIRIKPIILILSVLICFLGIVAFELGRYGMQNAARQMIPVLSIENIYMTAQYIMSAYFYSDLNNAMIMLGNPSDYSLVYGASSFISDPLWALFGIDPSLFNFQEEWSSGYGTINVMGIWWASAGWLSIAYISIVSILAGSLWHGIVQGSSHNVFGIVLYSLLVIGLINDLRINFFFLTKFLIPFLGFLAIFIFTPKHKISNMTRNR